MTPLPAQSSAKPDTALVVGEALVDILHPACGQVTEHVGGSPTNVAIALGRLERPVDLLTWIGHDVFGDVIRRHLQHDKVHLIGEMVSAPQTSVAIAHLGTNGEPNYEFDVSFDLPDLELIATDPLVLHIGSFSTTMQPGAAKVSELVSRLRSTATITYDPNIRPSLMGTRQRVRPIVARYLACADIVKASSEDLAWLEPGFRPEVTVAHWAHMGPALTILTRGSESVIAYTREGEKIELPVPTVKVADSLGAGDAFMGALIDGLWSAGLLGASRRVALRSASRTVLEKVLWRAIRAASLNCTRVGAQPPPLAALSTI